MKARHCRQSPTMYPRARFRLASQSDGRRWTLAFIPHQTLNLALHKRGVVAVLLHELPVVAGFDKVALLEDDDAVSVNNGGKAMGDDEGGAALHEAVQRFLYQRFGFSVE